MIRENIFEVRKRIISACLKAGRAPETLKLIAVSKNRSPEEIKEALLAGITAFGENRVQEALLKYNAKELALSAKPIEWHMVGHLQTNKVKDAVKIFDLIQSVDSLRLAQEINKEALKINKVQEILLEVKISPEATKFGLSPEETPAVIREASGFKNLKIKGLMAVAPILKSPEETRPYFRLLKDLRGRLDSKMILSMGMTDDFAVAIEEGSDMLRIGRAIFES
ncbi:MAG: YggS family pyridoxal phosphate-dependent enzyme [Candidatus Omnitrophica bacterium]|nr:YggS family pyridoxal phosphate-dependent enzyme [Candidatus Omnitrophota bacterium]